MIVDSVLLDPNIDLSSYGIYNNEEFTSWLYNGLGIKTHPDISIKLSEKGGLGLHFKVNDFSILDEDFTVFRIPSNSTLDIYTCLDLKNEIKIYETNHIKDPNDVLPSEHDILLFCLNYYASGNVSSTRILLAFLCGFLICKRIRHLRPPPIDSNYVSPLIKFDNYLDVLLNTKIGTIYKDDEVLLEKFNDLFPGNIPFRSAYSEYKNSDCYEFVNEVSKSLIDPSIIKNIIKGEEVTQLISAIRSRVSEIPRSLKKAGNEGNEQDEEVEDEEDDFVVNSTLVPFQDFANHCNANINAFFDVDRQSNDILLRIDTESSFLTKVKEEYSKGNIANGFEFEVLISYAPTVDINKFFFTYGFIPVGEATVKLFEIPFFGYFQFDNHAKVCEALNDLKITPNLQFVVLFDKEDKVESVGLNLHDNYCEFLLEDGFDIKHYIKSKQDIANNSNAAIATTKNIKPNETKEQKEYGDDEDDDNDESFEDIGGDIIQNIIEDINDHEAFENLSIKLLTLIKEYSLQQLGKLESFKKLALEWDTECEKNILTYVDFNISFYNKYISQYDEFMKQVDRVNNSSADENTKYDEILKLIDSIRLADDEIEDEWAEFRVPFIYNIYSPEIDDKFSKLSINP